MATWFGWQADVLDAIGAPHTDSNLQLLAAWQQAEGGTATFNPLNTTQPEPGATNYNSVGVKNYTSAAQGTLATKTTLENGNYDGILADLRAGNVSAGQIVTRNASEFSTWGTSVQTLGRVLGSFGGVAAGPPMRGQSTSLGKAATSSATPSASTNEHQSRLPAAFKHLVHALGVTLPTQTALADRVSKNYTRIVRARG